MKISFRQLRLFLALAEQGSVSLAARAMHVTQPTASMQLRDISDAVGLPVYEVIGKRVFLTALGQELAQTARTMVAEWARFEQQADALRGLKRGQLKVAVVSTAKYFVPRLLGSFCKQYPDIDVALEILNRDGVVLRLKDNRDDLYIMSIPPKALDIECQDFMPNPLVFIAPASHPLAQQKSLHLQQLATERFILRERGSGTRLACDAHFSQCRFKPQVRLELGSNESIKQAVAGGLGISVVSQHALSEHGDDSLAILDVQQFPIQASWYLVYPRGKRLSPIAEVFRTHLASEVRALHTEWSEPVANPV